MATFDIILIAGISATILLLILMIVSFIQVFLVNREYSALEKAKPKSKRRRRRWRRALDEIEDKRSKKIRITLFSLLAALLIGGGTGYAKYYQSTTISEQDIDNIVYGYYLLEQIEEQIQGISETSDQKSEENIHTLAVSLSSFASKKGSDRSTVDAQILLNQYYARIGQFGVNISSQNFKELKETPDKQEEYLNDIATIKKTQKKVIDFYKIDEKSLKSKK